MKIMPEESIKKKERKKERNEEGLFFFFSLLSELNTENIGQTKKDVWEPPHTVGGKNSRCKG